MPELPEVYTISQDLNKNITGYEINNIHITRNYKLPNTVRIKLNKLVGEKILIADNISKNISLKMSNNQYLVFHLAMTGRLLLRSNMDIDDKWVKIVFDIVKNGNVKYLKFCDMRQFGKIKVLNENEINELRNKYGSNPLDPKNSPQDLLNTLRSKRTNIKNALLDQKIIFGLGNIYATDSLFLSGINPKISTHDLTIEDSNKLQKSICNILKEGIKNRGSTLPDKMYVDIFGKSGKQQNYFKIYGMKNCKVCNSKVEYEKINGRGTYYCPTCQPIKNN